MNVDEAGYCQPVLDFTMRQKHHPHPRSWTLRSFRFPIFPIRLQEFGCAGVLTPARISGQKNGRRRVVIVDDSFDAGQLLASEGCPAVRNPGLQPGCKVWPEPYRNAVPWGMAICNRSSFQTRNEG